MLQEFQVSITPLERDRYLVRTEKVAPGVPLAEEQVYWSVEDWLEQAKGLMDDPLLRLLQGTDALQQQLLFPAAPPQSSSNLVTLGQQLYDALFQGSLRDSWIMAQGIAHNQNAVLRLRLGVKGKLLPRLPWEVLHTGGRESLSSCYRPLATGTDIAFSRYQMNAPLGSPPLSFRRVGEEPLKILMAIAGPDDQDSLALEQEAQKLKAELDHPLSGNGNLPAIALTILTQPGREELTQALEQGQYQVFHYAGHSDLGDSGGDIYLVSREGLTEKLSGDDLAGLLANNGVQLAVFNSCRGADTAFAQEGDRDRNLAQALVKCGIPAVLAMAEQIPDEVALTLTRLFYRNLDRGYPIDLSLSRTRQGLISAYGSHQLYWALPVLYLHPNFDGALMDGGDRADLSQEFLELDDADEIPLALLSDDGVFADGGDEDEFLTPLDPARDRNGSAQLTDSGEQEEVAFIRGMLGELAESQGSEPAQVSTPSPPGPRPRQRQPKVKPLLWLIGGASACAIALLGFFFISSRLPRTPQLETASPSSTAKLSPDNLSQADTDSLAGFAIEQLSKGNLEPGARAVEELLKPERNALNQAEAALACVPPESLDNPAISFLRGRLAWQSVVAENSGSTDFAVDDARRLWEIAVKGAQGQPEQYQTVLPIYLNALGFAYYEEGKINRANQAWYDALDLKKEEIENPQGTSNPNTLNTYAGLALGLKKLSETQSGSQKTKLLNKALKSRQMVIIQDPLNFRPDSLSKNWLWSKQAIQDWRELMAIEES